MSSLSTSAWTSWSMSGLLSALVWNCCWLRWSKETPMAPLVDPREKAEKGLSSLSTPGDRFAYWLSQITSPFVVGLHRDRESPVAHGHGLLGPPIHFTT